MAGRPVELKFITHKTVKGVEWSTAPGSPPLVAISDSKLDAWDEIGASFSGDFRFVAMKPDSPYDLINVIWALGEPAAVLAAGVAACRLAAKAAVSGTGAVRALALVDIGPAASQGWLADIKVPTLLLRGRQSKAQPHDDAVAVHAMIPNSRLIEPEDCGENPVEKHPTVIIEAIGWFLSHLGDDHMDFPVNGEPVDPKRR